MKQNRTAVHASVLASLANPGSLGGRSEEVVVNIAPAANLRATLAPANQAQYALPVDLAWAAGFLDGEGCITATWQKRPDRPHPNTRIVVQLAQNDLATLQAFQEILGMHGKIYPQKRRAYHSRQCWMLAYWGRHAMEVLRALEPYLRRKRPEALLCLQFEHVGKLSVRSGPKGHSPEIWNARWQFVNDLKALK